MALEEIRDRFVQKFGVQPDVIALAPGRVNLIGEHTDYNDGFVFPAAIDKGLWIAAAKTEGSSDLFSCQLGQAEEFDARFAKPGRLRDWAKYPAGMAWALHTTDKEIPNLIAVVDSQIPIGSGISSSAAMELAFGVVWRELSALHLDNVDLAKAGQICENQFVGVNSGIMDQMACALGRKGMAMFLDTRSLEVRYAKIPDHLSIVLLDTKKPRALTDSAYNERRSQCEEASRILGVHKLRDADIQMLQAARSRMSDVVYRRARHVITENERCLQFADALDSGDDRKIGELMKASHESLRTDYEVSCPELDFMAEAAWSTEGCVGARMTGAGFGGACVALVLREAVQSFGVETLSKYVATSGIAGEAMCCHAAEGARVM